MKAWQKTLLLFAVLVSIPFIEVIGKWLRELLK